MFKSICIVLLGLTLTCVLVAEVPRVTSVEPSAITPGGAGVVKGINLDEGTVDKLYLTAGGSDIELEITEQTVDAIHFTTPTNTAMKNYRVMVLTSGAGATYMEQPVGLEVVDAETAKQRAEEEDVELEIIEAEPEVEP